MGRLTRFGLVVLGVVCDGASDNRKMFNLHGCDDKLVHKIVNVYSVKDHPIFSFLILATCSLQIYCMLRACVFFEINRKWRSYY